MSFASVPPPSASTPRSGGEHERLREVALRATRGPWKVYHAGNIHHGVETAWAERINASIVHAYASRDGFGNGSTRENAEFIAAASPDVVIDLLDENERLREALRKVEYLGSQAQSNAAVHMGMIARAALSGRSADG